jgi:hypothetical protein
MKKILAISSPVIHAEIKTNKNILLITKIKIHEY